MKRKIWFFLISYLTVTILYYPALFTYFSHDDFFHFKVSLTDKSLGEFIKLFGFYPFNERLIAFYRPIFREVLYNTFYNLFGLNAIPFRILSFTLHFINIFLVFSFFKKLFKKRNLAYLTTFFFAISSANVASFYYLAGGIQTQGVLVFILLSLISFQKYLNTNNSKVKFYSFILFLLSLASHEQAVVLPLLLAGLIILKFGIKKLRKKIFDLWPYFITEIIYLLLNIFLIGYSSSETQYQLILSFKTTLQSLIWYSVWALGIPEMLADFLLPGFSLNPNLMLYWRNYYIFIFSSFFISILIIFSYTILILIKKVQFLLNPRFLFLLLWFSLGLLPVLFLPQHKSSHYLYPILPAFWGALFIILEKGYIILRKYFKFIAEVSFLILIISLTILSSTSAFLGKSTYWASQRGKLAEKLIHDVKTKYPRLPKGSVIFFTNDPSYPYLNQDWGGTSKQAYFALNGQDALQLLYKDLSLKVFYEDMGGIPDDFKQKQINILEASI